MDKKEKNTVERFLTDYFQDIHKVYTDGDFREESFYPSLKHLVEDCSKLFQAQAGVNVLVAPRKTQKQGFLIFGLVKMAKSLDTSRQSRLIPTLTRLRILSNSKDTGILFQILS